MGMGPPSPFSASFSTVAEADSSGAMTTRSLDSSFVLGALLLSNTALSSKLRASLLGEGDPVLVSAALETVRTTSIVLKLKSAPCDCYGRSVHGARVGLKGLFQQGRASRIHHDVQYDTAEKQLAVLFSLSARGSLLFFFF
mmetsp:Transcript_7295/g.20287  ORF Transcript_7295/g.20287 Transcript_7295/m.20287 type:complete len:141 (+) Transcript_7295:188-610(+)